MNVAAKHRKKTADWLADHLSGQRTHRIGRNVMTGISTLGWIGLGKHGSTAGDPPREGRLRRDRLEPHRGEGGSSRGGRCILCGGHGARKSASRDAAFSMVSTGLDPRAGDDDSQAGLLTGDSPPGVIIDCSTASVEASAKVRAAAEERGVRFFSAPVSGNGKVVAAGKLSVGVQRWPRDSETFEMVKPMIEALGRSVTYVGEGEAARLVKIYHNLLPAPTSTRCWPVSSCWGRGAA